jgi:Kef-type K+ transport system membrane component KefB
VPQGPLTDIAICIVAAWLFGVAAQALRQPPLLAYLLAGYVIGPESLGMVTTEATIDAIAEIGLLLLLFIIGIEIDLKRVLGSGRAILMTGAVQIVGTFVLGLALFLMLGQPLGEGHFEALYLAIAAFASSTVIAVKILADRRELDTLTGRIAIGISVIQDVALIIFLGMQPALQDPSLSVVALTFAKIGVLIGIALGASRYLLPPLFHRVARLPELISVGALAWCFLVAALAHALSLSPEMGALVAGIAISTFPYHLDVTAKVTSLRDFFITLFFVGLGLNIPAPAAGPIAFALILCVFIVLSRLLTVIPPLRLLGLGNRVSVVTALNLIPLSEFSLVLISLGIEAGHVDRASLPPIVYAFFFLAVIGSYAIGGSDRLFLKIEPRLRQLGLRDRPQEAPSIPTPGEEPDIYILGFSWAASSLLHEVTSRHPGLATRFVVIDFNPEVHHKLVRRGMRAIWGDVSQRDTLEHAGLRKAHLILCTLPNSVLRGITNVRLVRLVRSLNPEACVVAHAEVLGDVARLKEAGATYVNVSRLHDADELISVLEAFDKRLLHDKMADLQGRLLERDEVVL